MNKYFIFFLLISLIISKDIENNIKIIPLAGQIENKKYVKALILGASMTYATYKFIDFNKKDKISKRNTYAWWMIGLYFYSIIDAYVDMHLKDFPKNKKEIN